MSVLADRRINKLVKMNVQIVEYDKLIAMYRRLAKGVPTKKARFFEDKMAVVQAKRNVLAFKYDQMLRKVTEN